MKLPRLNIDKTQSIIYKNLSWAVIGKIIEVLNGILIGALVARYLLPERYGILNYTIGYVGMFALLSEFGISGILIRELSKKATNKKELIGSAIATRLFFSGITIIIIAISVFLFEDDPTLRLFIIINSLNFLFLSFSMSVRNFFTSQLKNELIVKSEIIRALIMLSMRLILVLLKAPLITFVIVSTLDSLFIAFPLYNFLIKVYSDIKHFIVKYKTIKMLIWASTPLLLEGIAAVLYQKIDLVMAGRFIGNEAVGYYAVALKFINFAIFIPLALTQTLSPLLIQKYEAAKYNANNKAYALYRQKVGDIIIYSGLFVSLALFIMAKPIINILYGPEYHDSIEIMKILAWKGLFCGLGYTASVMIVTEGRQKYIYLRNIIGGILNLTLNLLLIPLIGLKGVAIATIISFGVATYIANVFIPIYRKDFYLQTNFLFKGNLRLIIYIKSILKKKISES